MLLTVLILYSALNFTLVLTVLLMWFLSQQKQTTVMQTLLTDQRNEAQSLRNQLRAPDVGTLMGLSQATLPSRATAATESSDPIDVTDLGEAISYEEQLARAGYSTGDLGYDLESAGWSQPVVKRDGSGDPIAYDVTG